METLEVAEDGVAKDDLPNIDGTALPFLGDRRPIILSHEECQARLLTPAFVPHGDTRRREIQWAQSTTRGVVAGHCDATS